MSASDLNTAPDPAISPDEVRAFRQRAIDNGYPLIRVRTRSKRPLSQAWQNGDSSDLLLNVRPDALNTGMLLGEFRCLDCDIDDRQVALKVEGEVARLLPQGAIVRCRSNSPRFAMIYLPAVGQPLKRTLSGPNGKIELLGHGQQVVVHGLHPSGAEYTWSEGRGPDTVPCDQLPAVSEEQVTELFTACGPLLGLSPASASAVAKNASGASENSNVVPFLRLPEGFRADAVPLAIRMLNMESGGAGIEPEKIPLDFAALAKGCAFIDEALKTGGKDYDQAQWMYTTSIATAFENGNQLAHDMAKGHPGYTHRSTEDMWNRKLDDTRSNSKLPWIGCDKIHAAGCKSCVTCPHFAAGKSPLNLGLSISTPDPEKIFSQVDEGKLNPVAALMILRDQDADIKTLLGAMNRNYAVTKYGREIMVATITGNEIEFMKTEDFHKMFANLLVFEEVKDGEHVKRRSIKVSRRWFEWTERRQYVRRGVVFEPGGPLEIENDMLNLWRGFGITPKPGDWSLMRTHIFNVLCSGKQEHFDYLIHWMAYAVRELDKPIGVAVAFLGAPGAGKGVVARTFGSFFGKHFTHITHGDQLTGRFNASLGTSCAVFLDEALWAGDKKGEGVLKALITEPTFQLEAKFRDPITVDNRLRITVASNNDWAVPTGIGDRRWFVLNVANTYAGTRHPDYWIALYAEIENGGAAAMLHGLLAMNLSGFDVRAIPHTAAKGQQQVLTLRGTKAWLYQVLQEGAIGCEKWNATGLTIDKNWAYVCYVDFSKQHREWQPEIKDLWSKNIKAVLGPCIDHTRHTISGERVRSFQFAPLADCRTQFETHVGAPGIDWELEDSLEAQTIWFPVTIPKLVQGPAQDTETVN